MRAPTPGNEKQFGEIGGSPICRRGEGRVKPRRQHVACAHVVMRGHDEMGQGELDRIGRRNGLLRFRLDAGELARQAVGTERIQKLKLGPTGGVRAPVREVDDLALMDSVDRLVRLLDETPQTFGQPMVAASRAARIVHALLNDGPVAIVSDDEAVQIEVETILDGGAVDLRHEPADIGERAAINSNALADRCEFMRRLPRLLAAAAADMDSEFAGQRLEPSLQRADDARGDAGGVPVHAHDRAERLKPEWMSESTQQLVATVSVDDRLADDRAEPAHAARKPQGHPPAVQRQIGAS